MEQGLVLGRKDELFERALVFGAEPAFDLIRLEGWGDMSELNERGDRVQRRVTGFSEDGGTVLLGELAEGFACEFCELVLSVFFHRLWFKTPHRGV